MTEQEDSDLLRKRVANIPADLTYEGTKLVSLAGQMGLALTDAQSQRLVRFLALVLKKNESMNLTAIYEWDKALVLHLIDSLLILPEFDEAKEVSRYSSFLDMGCGAGFPGIPLALVREDHQATLCDSVKKKIAAVDEFIAELSLGDRVHTTSKRLEELGKEKRYAYGCITARALASLPVLIEYATPMLRKHGCFIAVKGKPSTQELAEGKKAAEICGLAERSKRTVELPDDMGERTIIVYEKIGEPQVGLPRMVGEATKKPIHLFVSRETIKKRK